MSSQYWPEISTCLSEVEQEKLSLTKKAINLDTITAARERVNAIVEQMRVGLERSLEKQHASLIVFAIVAYLDEQIQSHLLEKGQGNWLPLQKDFYGAYNAGSLFYETIDKVVEDSQTPEIVFRTFYFILKKGFLGKYRDSKIHIAKYLDILKDKITVETSNQPAKDFRNYLFNDKKRIKPWHYYAGAGTASVVLLLVLYLSSSL